MRTVKARIVEYDLSGKTVRSTPITVCLCTGDTPRYQVAEIVLKDKGRIHKSIQIPIRKLQYEVNLAMKEAAR